MIKLNKWAMVLLLLTTVPASAMSISSLMLVNSDHQKGKAGIFTLTNSDDITYFLQTTVSKIDIKNNQIIKTPYNRSNLAEWDIVTKPSKVVIEPKMIKELMVEEVCGQQCSSARDRVYQIDITPVSYETKGGSKQNKVNMLFGFAPYYIVPAKESNVQYSLGFDGRTLNVSNSGNTLIKMVINQCEGKTAAELDALKKDKTKRCRINYTVLAGRDRDLELPPELRRSRLDIVVLNHDETIREERVVEAGYKE
ncbi:hypothetical protein [Photobacterium indicum]|uniref:hypothetical protein n=1 Tax=Photobacterium indicum TaxID=81447 RepID=UPI003D0C19CF